MADSDGDHLIIIRRGPRGGHDDYHGGSWKVAFADFAIAMMALFLVLWLVAATTPLQKEAIATYFSNPGIYNRTSTSNPVEMQGSTSLINGMPVHLKPSPSGMTGFEMSGHGAPGVDEATTVAMQVLRELARVSQEGRSASKSIQIRALPKAILLTLVHPEAGPMFTPGSAQMRPFYEDFLIALAPILTRLSLKLMITGHTNSAPEQTPGDNDSDNWRLSGQRAETTREILTFAGVPHEQIFQLAAMGSTLPLENLGAEAELNRRVDIMILSHKGERAMKTGHKRRSKPPSPVSATEMGSAVQAARENGYPK
ncbi:flagellar motor protein MotB [Endozoicomonas sp.]|uniref:flagellar motor protein MotB n=1 Tax=Endozoicomonas sp. TaxID=1892382 RepID=UPI00383A6543